MLEVAVAPESGSLSQRPPFTLLWKEVYQLSTPRLAPSVGDLKAAVFSIV